LGVGAVQPIIIRTRRPMKAGLQIATCKVQNGEGGSCDRTDRKE